MPFRTDSNDKRSLTLHTHWVLVNTLVIGEGAIVRVQVRTEKDMINVLHSTHYFIQYVHTYVHTYARRCMSIYTTHQRVQIHVN